MSGRSDKTPGDSPRGWIRGALVVVVIAAVLGVLGAGSGIRRPDLGALNIAGIAVMLLGLIAVVLSQPIAARLPQDRRDRAAVWIKLAGVLICAVGAMMVFYC